MPANKIEVFKQTELFRDLDETVVKLLADRAVTRRLERDEILFLAGDPANGMYVIESGSVRAFRTSPDGREQVIHVERAVTTVAELPVFDNGNYPSTVAAEEPTVVHFLAREDVLKTAISHPQLALAATRLLAGRLRRCAELVEMLSLRDAGQRLARFLLAEARRTGVVTADGTRLKLKLTHNQLAARIGTVREVVTRSFVRLSEDGMIVHEGKEVLIPDVRALEIHAGE